MRILLIAGGWSDEREISLLGADHIYKALEELGHEVDFLDLSRDFDVLLERAALNDFAFINLHGSPGEDGLVQAMLDNVGLPYQGSGPAGSFLALNKSASKQIYRRNGLLTPAWMMLNRVPENIDALEIKYPLFVKPEFSGSSVGMSKVLRKKDLPDALELAFGHASSVLLEEAVDGPELTCAVLGRSTLPPILIKPVGGAFFDYKSKYTVGATEEICPAPISPELEQAVRQAALTAHQTLGLKGYSRSDFIYDEKHGLQILETNTLPGMTPISLLPAAAAVAGYSYAELVAALIDL